MDFDAVLFKVVLLQQDKTVEDIAKAINKSPSTLYRKINGESDFYRNEIIEISEYLHLNSNQREQIFFAKKITYTQ